MTEWEWVQWWRDAVSVDTNLTGPVREWVTSDQVPTLVAILEWGTLCFALAERDANLTGPQE